MEKTLLSQGKRREKYLLLVFFYALPTVAKHGLFLKNKINKIKKLVKRQRGMEQSMTGTRRRDRNSDVQL